MARDPASDRPTPLYLHPWSLILAGAALTILASLLGAAFARLPDSYRDNLGAGAAIFRFLVVVLGMFTAITGLTFRLKTARWDLIFDRIETAAMVGTTGTAALGGYFAMNSDWESGKMLFGALVIVCVVGSALVLLPSLLRRIALSLIIIFHFAGMVTAITSIDPPNGTGPWVSKQLWAGVYRQYLSFLYMTNAYHFYSPDPGPPSLMWFAVHYDDGTYRWVKLPERANSPIGMHYQRMLALPEHTFVPLPRLPYSDAELAILSQNARRQGLSYERPARGSWEEISNRRMVGSTQKYPLEVSENGKAEAKNVEIPMVSGMLDTMQYREPHDTSKKLISGVARRIFWTAPKSEKGGKVKSVKVYRVTHHVIPPSELARGGDPLDKTRHWAYFMGEFEGRGHLVNPFEPFLYWYLPIVNVEKGYPDTAQRAALGPPVVPFGRMPSKDTFLLDGLEMHAAGEVRQVKQPGAKQ